jgi:hypothetical protein
VAGDSESRQAPADVHALLDRIDEAWRRLLAVLDDVPGYRLADTGAVGDWSVQDLFGHIAFWDRNAIKEMERALAGLPREENAWQAMNDADHAARRGQPLSEQRSAMHQAHAELVARLEAVAGIAAEPLDAAMRPDTYEHYDEHAKDIREWRERAGA